MQTRDAGGRGSAELSFGRWLQRRRRALDLTQAELGLRVGYAAVTIHKIETDQLRPSRDMAHKLADALAIGDSERDDFVRFAREELSSISEPILLPPLPQRTSAAPRRNNLPFAPTRLLGREDEVHRACELLRGETRLLTLIGPGGIGKTHLGLEVATALANTFADGVWWADLAPLADRDLLVGVVSAALGVRDNSSQSLLASLTRALGDQQLLLVLDNCEHLIDECAQLVEAMLSSAPGVHILATSRVPFRLPAEVRVPIGPLTSPPSDAVATVDDLSRYAAARLFVERAAAVRPNFAITDQNASAVASVCQRLDGIPLALELAAARVSALTVEQIASRLDDRFRLLTTGIRTALPRHRTLRATLDWSYDLLGPRDRRLFERLGVLAGSWTIEAAEVIGATGDASRADVFGSLANLVDQSLVMVEDDAEQRRYRLLETVRQYAWERLLESGDAADAQRQHLRFYLEWAEQSDPEVPGTQQHRGFRHLAAESDNLRLALAWSLDNDPQQALRLAACLADFWRRGAHHAEGRRWLNAVLSAVDAALAPADAHGRVLLGAGLLAGDAGEFGPEQVSCAEASVQLLRQAGNTRALNYALIHLGRCIMAAGGSIEQVQQAFNESLQVARSSSYEHGIGFSLANLAHMRWCEGKHQEALHVGLEALHHIRASGDVLYAGLVLGLLGWYSMEDGNLDVARRYKQESVEILQSLGAKEALGLALLGMAHLERQAGNSARLPLLLKESASLLRETGSPGLSDWLTFAGQLELERGNYENSVRLLAAGESDGPRFGSLRALLYPPSNDALDVSLSTAKSVLSEGAFQAAWREGKAIQTHEAVAIALA